MTTSATKTDFFESVQSGQITHLTLVERRLPSGHTLVGADDRRGVPLEIIVFDEEGMILKSPLGFLFSIALEGALKTEGKNYVFYEGTQTLVYSASTPFEVKSYGVKHKIKNFLKKVARKGNIRDDPYTRR